MTHTIRHYLLLFRLLAYIITAGCAHSGKSRVTVPPPYDVNFLISIRYLDLINKFHFIIIYVMIVPLLFPMIGTHSPFCLCI